MSIEKVEEAVWAFVGVLRNEEKFDGAVLLDKAGWEESCPSEHAWHFSHAQYPGVRVDWFVGRKVVGHATDTGEIVTSVSLQPWVIHQPLTG